MRDVPEQGYRPERNGVPSACPEAELLAACPGAGSVLTEPSRGEGITSATTAANGPTLEIWEGHATDHDLRFAGASGGALSALAAYCIEKGGMEGVLHVGADPNDPLRNRTVFSRTREELKANTGSRYAPASVCEGIDMIDRSDGPCVFIGQPSEVTALRKIQALRPALESKVGVALSFFCAGSPPVQGTLDLLRENGIDPAEVTQLRYRGRGWPGNFAVWVKGQSDPVLEMTYAESWAFLQRYRPWSVQIWPDGSGEHADITCGDPWHRAVEPGEAGSSLVIARTETGRRIIRQALEAGYLELKPLSQEKLIASQRNLITKKGSVWGRLQTMWLMGIPTPRHRGYSLFRIWCRLSLRDKGASFVGTARRIHQRGYRIRGPAEPYFMKD